MTYLEASIHRNNCIRIVKFKIIISYNSSINRQNQNRKKNKFQAEETFNKKYQNNRLK